MATAREESSLYDGGLGTGGKFKKRPFRRTTQTTPYDRPPTAIRNPINSSSNGWLSKLLDPAHSLITSSAHKLFASFFQKRLPPPPPPQPQLPEPERIQEARQNHKYATLADLPVEGKAAMIGGDNASIPTNKGEIVELEQILKQKTFTRSEIDRLSALLQSRTVDTASRNECRPEERQTLCLGKKEEFSKTPITENGAERHVMSTNIVNSKVIDEDAASPIELAKAYMGSRPNASPSMLSLRGQALREDSCLLSNQILPSKSPIMSLVPRSSGHVGGLGNGFVTPRSRGRSAIYSMARTPYSRVTSTPCGFRPRTDAFAGPSSSSQTSWEQSKLSGSRQGALKRRISVFDNDIGSVGPIRRIRQKSNLLSPRSLSLPYSGSPLSINDSGTGAEAPNNLSLIQKPVLPGEVKHASTKMLAENGDNDTPSTSYRPVSSKSSEMASKILQQLDKIVSPKEKSPAKLSPSMLRGPALKSLENIDSSKFLEDLQDDRKVDGLGTATLPDVRDSTVHKLDKVEETGPAKLFVPDNSGPTVNGVSTTSLIKDSLPTINKADSSLRKSVAHLPERKRQGFQMSAHEDYLDLDDDDFYPNGAVSTTDTERQEKLETYVVGSENIAAQAVSTEKPYIFSESKPLSSFVFNQKPDSVATDGSAVVEKKAGNTFPADHLPSTSVQLDLGATQSTSTTDKAAFAKESNTISPAFGFAEKVASLKEPNSAAPTFSFGSTNTEKVPSVSAWSEKEPENSSSSASVVIDATGGGKFPELGKPDEKNISKPEFFLRTPDSATFAAVSTSSPGSVFKFGIKANGSNGSLTSNPSLPSPTSSVVPNDVASQISFISPTQSASTTNSSATATTVTTMQNTSGSLFSQASVPSFTAAQSTSFGKITETTTKDTSFGNLTGSPSVGASAFVSSGSSIFGGTSSVSSTVSSTSGSSSAITGTSTFSSTPPVHTGTGGSIFAGTSSSNTSTSSSLFGGTPSTLTSTGSNFVAGTSASSSTGSSIFAGTSVSTSTGSGIFAFGATAASISTQSQGSNPFAIGNTQGSTAGSVFATSTQSIPIQFGSSASSPSFGLAGTTNFSSGSSLFGSSAVGKTFGSGTTFGLSSSSSDGNSVSTNSSATTNLFGTSWQTPQTTIFGSAFNSSSSSTGFTFGASSTSVAPSNGGPTIFGSSNSASLSSIFPYTSAAAAAATPTPVFGSSNTSFGFGSTPSSNSEQMEDSMAEDTVLASTPAVPTFGQPISAPASGFVFGAASSSGSNPFQFAGQQNMATPQNPSPFQASGSLEFTAGGSFSLGTGGGDKSARKYVKVKHKPRKK